MKIRYRNSSSYLPFEGCGCSEFFTSISVLLFPSVTALCVIGRQSRLMYALAGEHCYHFGLTRKGLMETIACPKLRQERNDPDVLGFRCAGKVSPYAATGSSMFFMLKAFGAGVILATGFIHMWPDANDAFSSACLGGCPTHIKQSLAKALGSKMGTGCAGLSGTAMLWCSGNYASFRCPEWSFAKYHRAG